MNFYASKKLPVYFWVVGLIALLWYAYGVYNFLMQAFMNTNPPTQISQTEHLLYDNLPLWYMTVFGFAVFSGFLGALLWLLRKRRAYILFIISFFTVGIQQFYVLTEINPRDIFLPLTSNVIAVFLVWFSKRAIARRWLK